MCSVKANQNKTLNSIRIALIQIRQIIDRCKSALKFRPVCHKCTFTSMTFLLLELAIGLFFYSAINKRKFYKDILPVPYLADQITAMSSADRIRKEDLNVN